MKKIIITKLTFRGAGQLLAGLFDESRMIEAHVENPSGKDPEDVRLGNIYVGKVSSIVKNIGAAFVDIAPGLSCYYPYQDHTEPVFVRKTSKKPLAVSDEILVQIQQERIKTKAPMVSSNLNLAGRYAVITSENKRIGISSRLRPETRENLKTLISRHYPGPYGVIVRTNAAEAPEEDLLSEITFLSGQMDDLIRKAASRACFCCMYHSEPKYLDFLRNVYSSDLGEIVTDQKDIFEQLCAYCSRYEDMKGISVRLYEDDSYPLSALYNMERLLERAVSKKVWLPSGGFLVIEPTEALTVIDVNTGKSRGGSDPQIQYKKTNLEAAAEIARQIRLRNLSGIIIIDFIDMKNKDDQQALLEALKMCVREDTLPVQIHDITRLNLVEMTRRKREKPLAAQLAAAADLS